MRPSLQRCREILGVAPGASAEETKQSWRDLVKVWHPDRFAGDARLAAKATARLREINEAWDLLSKTPSEPAPRAPAPDPLVDFLNDLRRRT